MKKIKFCKACGKINQTAYKEYCKKHYMQLSKYGKILDNNPRTIWDKNEIRILDTHAEIDTYDELGNVLHTYLLDIEDILLLEGHKWRSIIKRNIKQPYLGTKHTIYFHRLLLGNPNCDVDHINQNTLDNRKINLREASDTVQRINSKIRIDNTQGIKGIYYLTKNNKYRAEISFENKKIYSKAFCTKEEACYMRYLLEIFFFSKLGFTPNKNLLKGFKNLKKETKKEIQFYFKNRAKAWV